MSASTAWRPAGALGMEWMEFGVRIVNTSAYFHNRKVVVPR